MVTLLSQLSSSCCNPKEQQRGQVSNYQDDLIIINILDAPSSIRAEEIPQLGPKDCAMEDHALERHGGRHVATNKHVTDSLAQP